MAPTNRGISMGQWFKNLGERFQNFMQGRNGTDDLNRALLIVALVLIVLGFFISGTVVYTVSYLLCIVLIVVIYLRMFSKNLTQRRRENERYHAFRAKVGKPFESLHRSGKKNKARATNAAPYLKENKVYTCKECGQMLRVPKGKGKVKVTCPKCGASFIKHT
jgi:uncharacterized paraquat-inducible protein A